MVVRVAVPEGTALAVDDSDEVEDADTRTDCVESCVALGSGLLVASALLLALIDTLNAEVADLAMELEMDNDATPDKDAERDEDGDGAVEHDTEVDSVAVKSALAEVHTLPLTVRGEEAEATTEELPECDELLDSDSLAVTDGDTEEDTLTDPDGLERMLLVRAALADALAEFDAATGVALVRADAELLADADRLRGCDALEDGLKPPLRLEQGDKLALALPLTDEECDGVPLSEGDDDGESEAEGERVALVDVVRVTCALAEKVHNVLALGDVEEVSDSTTDTVGTVEALSLGATLKESCAVPLAAAVLLDAALAETVTVPEGLADDALGTGEGESAAEDERVDMPETRDVRETVAGVESVGEPVVLPEGDAFALSDAAMLELVVGDTLELAVEHTDTSAETLAVTVLKRDVELEAQSEGETLALALWSGV